MDRGIGIKECAKIIPLEDLLQEISEILVVGN